MKPKNSQPVREENRFVGNATDIGRVPPDIPALKKKEEEERKGGGLVGSGATAGGRGGGGGFFARLFGVGGRGGAGLARGGATAARAGLMGGARLGFGPMLVNFLASNMGAVLLTALLTGGAVYTLYSLGMSAVAEKPAKSSVFPTAAKTSAGEGNEARVDASGLSYFQTANQGGAFNDPAVEKKDAPAEPKADEAKPAPEAKGNEVKDGVPEGKGLQLAESLTKQMKPKMVAGRPGGSMGAGNGLAGGAGMSGGMMKKFDGKPDDLKKGVATPMSRPTTAKLVARRITPVSGAKGGAQQQLRFTSRESRKALGTTSSEGQSFQAAEAFNTAPPTQGAKEVGGGVSDGSKGLDTSASPNDGGPLGTNPEKPAPKTGSQEDKSPYTQQLMMAMALLMTASTIITIIGILSLYKEMPIIGPMVAMIQQILYVAAIGMAASASAVGAMIMSKYGQNDQAMMVTIGGAITSATATAALFAPPEMQAWVAVIAGIAGIGASIGTMLIPMLTGKGAGK